MAALCEGHQAGCGEESHGPAPIGASSRFLTRDTVCPALPLADAENDEILIWVGGKVSNARTAPMFSKLVIPYLPNNPPRWPETVAAVKKIVETYARHGRKQERMGEWINRVGGERFFQLTGLEFTDKHIDDFTLAPDTYRPTTQFKWG